jgi:hypothetical protein
MIQPTDYKIEIEKWFEIGLNRSKINHISCISNRIKNENFTKEMVDELIKKEGKIYPEILQFFNNIEDYTSSKIITQQDEIDAIRASIIKSIEEIDKLMIEALEEPGLLYELNEYFVEIYDQLGKAINEMNCRNWIGTKKPNQNLDILYLQVNGKQISYIQFNLEINNTVSQTKQLREAFEQRLHLLEQYRSYITEVYARHLMLPSKKILPVIKYKEGSKTKIAELIYAIESENKTVIDSLKFTEFLLKIFDISRDQYKKICYDIRTRKVRAVYTKDLKDSIEKLPF